MAADGDMRVVARVAEELCIATPERDHPATRRTGRCDKHQEEFEKAMNRYSSALWTYRQGKGPKPPSRKKYKDGIKYSDVAVWGMIDPTFLEHLRWVHREETRATARLVDLVLDIDTPPHIAQNIRDYLADHEATLRLLSELTDPTQL